MEFTQDLINSLNNEGKSLCISSEQISQKLNLFSPKDFPEFSTRLYYYWISGEKPVPLSVVLHVMQKRNIKFIKIKSFSVGGGNKISLPKEKNILFSYFLGLLLGDGCLVYSKRNNSRGTYSVQISFRERKEAEEVKDYVNYLFNINSSIYNEPGCCRLNIYSKPLVIILNKKYQIPLGFKYATITVPLIIKNGYKTQKKAFIKGIFDSDGNMYVHRGSKTIQIRQKSERFIKEIKEVLDSLGLNFKEPYYDKANGSYVIWSSKRVLVDSFIKQICAFSIELP
ncbi:MAG: LAGLIDADG family homing endonuclease [Nanoarchaeota archaeon]|nr:LAGLIDADG family homing endonuclease [Nanoarchaeota archaeon]